MCLLIMFRSSFAIGRWSFCSIRQGQVTNVAVELATLLYYFPDHSADVFKHTYLSAVLYRMLSQVPFQKAGSYQPAV